jgi:hypothetical protein
MTTNAGNPGILLLLGIPQIARFMLKQPNQAMGCEDDYLGQPIPGDSARNVEQLFLS